MKSIFSHFEQLIFAHCLTLHEGQGASLDRTKLVVELPRDESHGDLATNAAMILAKPLGMSPRELAENIVVYLRLIADAESIASVAIAGPGFVNITLESKAWMPYLKQILNEKHDYGRTNIGEGQCINIEFVSANPTGPLHAAHARGAVFGDVLANLLHWIGFDVIREYYVNDAGSQVDILARSAYMRYCEALGDTDISIPEGLYPGLYLQDVGTTLKAKYGDSLKGKPESAWLDDVRAVSIREIMNTVEQDLEDLGVVMDVFSSERKLRDSGKVAEAVAHLKSKNLIYRGVLDKPKGKCPDDWEASEQLLFRSTAFGDDEDRSLQKSDGSWTYFACDMAYHLDKLNRTKKLHQTLKGGPRGDEIELTKPTGQLINIWGADHSGYVKRMKATTEALSGKPKKLDVKLCQLVTLLDKGKPVKMSKRAGNFVMLSDIIETVGADVIRFIMLTRRSDQTLEFDYAKVQEKSRDNPVFYVQYAHARCCSVLRQGQGQGQEQGHDLSKADLSLLSDPHEIRLIKHMVSWPHVIKSAALTHEPHRLAFYLIELASRFHALWHAGRDDSSLRFILDADKDKAHDMEGTMTCAMTGARLALVQSCAYILRGGLRLMSVQPVEDM